MKVPTGLRSLQFTWRSVLNTDAGKGAGRKSKICFHFWDHANCPKGDKCEYSHDKELQLTELRARGEC